MPTIEEIRTEWQGVRSAVGNLICYIDGKVAQLQDMSEAYRKGYNDGLEKAQKAAEEEKGEIFQTAYQRGLDDAWDAAKRMTVMQPDECLACFGDGGGQGAAYYYLDGIFKLEPQEAIQKMKEHDAIIRQVTHSNAQKFVEIFGFAPGYEVLDDGREVYPSLNDEWWNAEYKEPKGEVE